MKKLMSILLGLSLVLGAVAFAAGQDTETTKKTSKKSKKSKKTTAPTK